MANPTTITIRRPDDWHLHLRDGVMLAAVLPFTASQFSRAVIMPNLVPPVRRAAEACAYRSRILAALPHGLNFHPLMTCYLTDETDPDDLIEGQRTGAFFAAKLYPANATTNSQFGVTDLERLNRVLEAMEFAGMPLLVHGEVSDPAVDIFDREAVFIERVLEPIRRRFSALRITLEHVTTADGVAFVTEAGERTGGTVTPHHLTFSRNALFQGGLRPHFYCLPVAKRERHRQALRAAVTSGHPRFFLGTDSAPHLRSAKESACGCAGLFCAPTALAAYVQVFAEEGALDKFEAFAAENGARFYGLPLNGDRIALTAEETDVPEDVPVQGLGTLHPFLGGTRMAWRVDGRPVPARSDTRTP
ncbi:dihydroorotase [Blastochloris sulfoviridis]|uniref:Dihydroorotase n=1 Tax=Blastochloris sulfoviridis TaxID=50712 RepID=A0A5M6I275_9HYPH|nr:dihydroorotase [Blastochloris sulfoviridis]KAA5601925.1 dihydroorotase [Blastochloris sulfoviridis]